MTRFAALALVLVAAAGCGSGTPAPKADPGQAAVHVVQLISHNRYAEAWDALAPPDQKVAPREEYVSCESRSPVLTAPQSVRVLGQSDESVGLGDGTFVETKAVRLQLVFGAFRATQTVHLLAAKGAWRWILKPDRYRIYKANGCPSDAGSTPPPSSS
jgi:hypothetical protein